ncbi:MAG: hypothetical protein LUC43_07720 [Burkholderiales bacterium]|nr:hypothetical protein [Burkholderiales bacterium]
MAKITLIIRERDIASGLAKCDSDVVLPLEDDKIDLEKAEQGIRSTGRYRLLLRGPEDLVKDCAKWRLSLNGKELDAVPHWNKGQRQVEIPAEERIFKDLLAFALFSLRLDPSASNQETLFAPPVKVFLDGHSGDQIKEMSNYVTEHAQGILLNRKAPKIVFTKVEPGKAPDFSDVVDFLRDIVQTYQFDADYFRSNSRYRIKLEGRVDAMEKLRYFTAETLRFISMHPEELVPASSSTGIRYGGLSLEPVRTWIQGDKVDRNVYENQIVLGFLQTVIKHTEELIKQTNIGNIPKEEILAPTRLTDSADLVQRTDKEKLQEMAEALLQLNNRLRRLYNLYKEFMGADSEHITKVPEPTAVFLSIPAYNRIYNLLHRWFALREVTLEKNAFFMDAWRSSRAYEYYCLIRLIEEIKAKG